MSFGLNPLAASNNCVIIVSLWALRVRGGQFLHVQRALLRRERRGSLDVFSTPVVFVLLAREIS